MKNRHTFILYFLLVVGIFTNSSCEKEPEGPALPAATQEGKETFGCRVNGKAWVPTTDDFMANILSAEHLVKDKKIVIVARISTDISQGFSIVVDNLSEWPREYLLQNPQTPISADSAYGRFRSSIPGPEKVYFTGNLKPGKLVITKIDTVENIVSGLFEFEAIESQTGEKVEITDGRFDIRYYRFK